MARGSHRTTASVPPTAALPTCVLPPLPAPGDEAGGHRNSPQAVPCGRSAPRHTQEPQLDQAIEILYLFGELRWDRYAWWVDGTPVASAYHSQWLGTHFTECLPPARAPLTAPSAFRPFSRGATACFSSVLEVLCPR